MRPRAARRHRPRLDVRGDCRIVPGPAGVLAQVAKVAKTIPRSSSWEDRHRQGIGRPRHPQAVGTVDPAFIRVNCAAIPPSSSPRSFRARKGGIHRALQRGSGVRGREGGTYSWTRSRAPRETQVVLLRVLQEREIERVGSSHPIPLTSASSLPESRSRRRGCAWHLPRDSITASMSFPSGSLLARAPGYLALLITYLVERYARRPERGIRRSRNRPWSCFKPTTGRKRTRIAKRIERAVVLCEDETFVVDESWLKRRPTVSRSTVSDYAPRVRRPESKPRSRSPRAGFPAPGAAAKLGIPRQTLESKIKPFASTNTRFEESRRVVRELFGARRCGRDRLEMTSIRIIHPWAWHARADPASSASTNSRARGRVVRPRPESRPQDEWIRLHVFDDVLARLTAPRSAPGPSSARRSAAWSVPPTAWTRVPAPRSIRLGRSRRRVRR